MNLFVNGKSEVIEVDDYLPFDPSTGNLAFCRAKELPEIWMNFLEKAWAKVNRSYAMTIAGLPSEALSVLTEAPTYNYIHSLYSVNEMFEILLDADVRKYVMCTSTGGSSEEAERRGRLLL